MIDATESRIVFRGSKVEVPAGGIASQARTADELNDIMRLMMKAALEKCWWYNPRDGKAELIKTTASNGNETFNPPGDAVRKNDWLLVIDDASKGWGAPGAVSPL